jgi:hypothetical protein
LSRKTGHKLAELSINYQQKPFRVSKGTYRQKPSVQDIYPVKLSPPESDHQQLTKSLWKCAAEGDVAHFLQNKEEILENAIRTSQESRNHTRTVQLKQAHTGSKLKIQGGDTRYDFTPFHIIVGPSDIDILGL